VGAGIRVIRQKRVWAVQTVMDARLRKLTADL